MKGLNFTIVGSSLGLLLSVNYITCLLWPPSGFPEPEDVPKSGGYRRKGN